MRYLPFVAPNPEETPGEPALIVIQQDSGVAGADSFVIGRGPVSWAERQSDRWHETHTRDIAPTVFAAHEHTQVDLLTEAFWPRRGLKGPNVEQTCPLCRDHAAVQGVPSGPAYSHVARKR